MGIGTDDDADLAGVGAGRAGDERQEMFVYAEELLGGEWAEVVEPELEGVRR